MIAWSICFLRGHAWGDWEYGGTGNCFTGYLEVRHCQRCTRCQITQVPQ